MCEVKREKNREESGRIRLATEDDRAAVLALYRSQLGRPFCPWNEHYPGEDEITYDLSRDALLVMEDAGGNLLAAISLDLDEAVETLPCWSPELAPGAELSRMAVSIEHQNRGLARQMMRAGMQLLKDRGYRSVHFLVNRHNVKALRSYEPLGCELVGEAELWEQPFLCYEKML